MPTNEEINFIGETTFRNKRVKFGIKKDDRRRHVYLIGKTGSGKTALMQNMAIQDIQNGQGIGFIDPHGEAAEELLNYIPSHRINDVVYFNPGDMNFPVAFNVMEKVSFENRHLVASGLLAVFKKIWPDVWSARMEYILNNTILALLEYPGSTLLGVNRMLGDTEYRQKVVDKITDPVIKSFWTNEFARYSQRYETEATAAIQNKIGQFISAPLVRNIIGQVQSSINMREAMDDKKILIINLSKGKIGEDVSLLLGGLLITKLQLAAMSRIDIPENKRNDFYLYVDEFQHFATRSFTNILSEARKYRLCLSLGHQYIAQMEEEVADAVFGNVGTLIVFRVGAEDAEYFEKEFSPDFLAADFVGLPKYNIYLRLLIDGISGRPFSAQTFPPILPISPSNREKIINVSRERYTSPREEVEEKIKKWFDFAEGTKMAIPQSQGTLYDARCSLCGKDAKVTFLPDPTRPVYCKSCMKKVKRGDTGPMPEARPATGPREKEFKEIVQKPATISLKEITRKEPKSFSGQKLKGENQTGGSQEVHLEEVRKALAKALKKTKK